MNTDTTCAIEETLALAWTLEPDTAVQASILLLVSSREVKYAIYPTTKDTTHVYHMGTPHI